MGPDAMPPTYGNGFPLTRHDSMFAIDQTKPDQWPKNLDGGIFLRVITGLRYYSPRLGRWTTRDPIGEKGGRNLNRFVMNAAVGRVDLLGLYDIPDLQPHGETVVTVPLPDPNDPDESGNTAVRRDDIYNGAAENGLVFVPLRPVGDFARQFNRGLKEVCGCIDELIITGHGTGGTQVFGPSLAALPDQTLTVYYTMENGRPVPHVQNIEIFEGVHFCKPCAILLTGCATATGPDWRDLYSIISERTGCRVYGYDMLSYPGGNYPIGGPMFGRQPVTN